MASDTAEPIVQVGKRIDAESLARGDQAGQRRGGSTSLIAVAERPNPPITDTFPQSEDLSVL